MDERFLITGSEGCIGAWVLRQLVAEGVPCVAFDLVTAGRRLRQIAGDEVADAVTYAQGDLTRDGDMERVMEAHAPTHIVHLAGLQVPFVAADPVLGALVNVVGTVRVLEAARHSGGTVRGVSYASSAAVYDPEGELRPRTLYGVYKRCNEETARHYAESLGVSAVGLRPWTVFGVGRDQGVTSAPTSAIQAVVRGESYEIPFSGAMSMQYTADVAAAFVGRRSRAGGRARLLRPAGRRDDRRRGDRRHRERGARSRRPHHEHRRRAADRRAHARPVAARADSRSSGHAVRGCGRPDRRALRRARLGRLTLSASSPRARPRLR